MAPPSTPPGPDDGRRRRRVVAPHDSTQILPTVSGPPPPAVRPPRTAERGSSSAADDHTALLPVVGRPPPVPVPPPLQPTRPATPTDHTTVLPAVAGPPPVRVPPPPVRRELPAGPDDRTAVLPVLTGPPPLPVPARAAAALERAPAPAPAAGPHPPAPARGWLRRPGWLLTALLVLYPVWWLLGVTPFIVMLVAVPMAVELYRRRPLRVPAGFTFWMIGVIGAVASGVMLGQEPPHALPLSAAGYLSFVMRLLNYLALTVILLYVGNLTERELPRLRIVRMLSLFFLFTVAGGVAGLLFPEFSWRTPVLQVLQQVVPVNEFARRLFTVELAQVQQVLGSAPSARPAAPFEYTNTWGYVLSLTLVWFVLGWWVYGRRWRRLVVPIALAVAVVTVVYSLNRGVWIGLGLTVLYLVVKFALRGRMVPLVGLSVAGVVLGAAFLASPLPALVADRLDSGHSDDTRAGLNADAVEAALHSPILGYGGPRSGIGSSKSIAIGPTDQCPQCGSRTIGSDGHLWFLLISQGFVGAAAFVGWLLRVLWVYRRDSSPIGIAGQLALLLPLFYMLVYPSLLIPLALTVIAVGLLWRNAQHRDEAAVGTA